MLAAGKAVQVDLGTFERYQITVVKNPDLIQVVNDNAQDKFNREKMLYGAPVYILVSATGDLDNAVYSSAATIVENMILAAFDQGLVACHIWRATVALAQNKELCAKLGLNDDQVPVAAMTLGVPAQELEQRSGLDRIAAKTLDQTMKGLNQFQDGTWLRPFKFGADGKYRAFLGELIDPNGQFAFDDDQHRDRHRFESLNQSWRYSVYSHRDLVSGSF